MKSLIVLMFLPAVFFLSCVSGDYEYGVDRERKMSPYVVDEENVAVGGYDPVAYFTLGKGVVGAGEHPSPLSRWGVCVSGYADPDDPQHR